MLLNGPSHEEEQEREEEKGESKIQGLFIIGSKKMCWLFLFNDTLQTLPYAAPPIGKIQPTKQYRHNLLRDFERVRPVQYNIVQHFMTG